MCRKWISKFWSDRPPQTPHFCCDRNVFEVMSFKFFVCPPQAPNFETLQKRISKFWSPTTGAKFFFTRLKHVESGFQNFGHPPQAPFLFLRKNVFGVEVSKTLFAHRKRPSFLETRRKRTSKTEIEMLYLQWEVLKVLFAHHRRPCVESGFQNFGRPPAPAPIFFFEIKMCRKWISKFWSPATETDLFI